jgi:hypothetical protein
MAAPAPIPTANVITEMNANVGLRNNRRMAVQSSVIILAISNSTHRTELTATPVPIGSSAERVQILMP